MAYSSVNIQQRILVDKVEKLYTLLRNATLFLLAASTICWLLLITKVPSPFHLSLWYAATLLILLTRWLHMRKYETNKLKHHPPEYWLNTYRLLIAFTGLIYGSINIFFFLHDSLPQLAFALFFPFGILVGAISILLDFPSFIIYTATLTGPIILKTFFINDFNYIETSILSIALTAFCIKMSKEYNNNYISSLLLQYDNNSLVQQLKEEKNTLNNRLGRILNDSSNEIFILDAESFLCLQVNRGAVENLGYDPDEINTINIIDIFTNFNQQAFEKLILPLRDGSKEFIIFKGESRRKNGSVYPVEARLQLSTEDSKPIIIITVQNITERSEWEEKLIYQANFDQLTGLPNRHFIQSVISTAFTRAQRNQEKVAVLFLDLDNFKSINDSLGHRVGDEMLQETADRLRTLLRKSDVPARTGGDEFTILLERLQDSHAAGTVARKLITAFQEPFLLEGRELFCTFSIGISIFPDDGESLEQLMKYADMAMYQAKETGRNKYCYFSQKMCQDSEEQILIISHLRNALTNNEFSLSFQPKIDINKGLIGAEALLRWKNSELGNVVPDEFIHLAESMGFIEDIGSWVVEEACREAMYWRSQLGHSLQVSVNVSPQQFRTGSLIATVEKAMAKSGLPNQYLELEITEGLLLQDSDKPFDILTALHNKGIGLALDDFGTGYSSLSYLKRFPLKTLKIDRSFIRDLKKDEHSRALVEAIIAMAQSMKLEVVAEGIESEEQKIFLGSRGVTVMQGYFFSRPLSSKKFRTILQGGLPHSWRGTSERTQTLRKEN